MQSQVYTFTNALAVEQSNCLRAALPRTKSMPNSFSLLCSLKNDKKLAAIQPSDY